MGKNSVVLEVNKRVNLFGGGIAITIVSKLEKIENDR